MKIILHGKVKTRKNNGSGLNPDYALGIYSNKILLYIYFSTHFSVLDVVLTTPAGEKFRAS